MQPHQQKLQRMIMIYRIYKIRFFIYNYSIHFIHFARTHYSHTLFGLGFFFIIHFSVSIIAINSIHWLLFIVFIFLKMQKSISGESKRVQKEGEKIHNTQNQL